MLVPRLLVNAARTSSVVQKRSMASLKNFKRPSMDEYVIPTEPWAQYKARKIQYLGGRLAVSIVVLGVVLSVASQKIRFYRYPAELVDEVVRENK